MNQDLYEIEEQTTNLNLQKIIKSEAVTQDRGGTIRTNSTPDPQFIAFVVLVSAALLFVASIYYGIINP